MKNADKKPKAEKLSPKAKQTVQISEEIYHQLMDNSGIGVGVYSLDGKIIMFNKKALQYLKGKTEDYVGKSLKEVFGEQTESIYIQRIQAAAKSDKSIEFEDFVQMPSGSHWFLSNFSRIKNLDGEVVGVQALAHDITERKKAEEKILKLNRIYAVISQINQAIVYHKNKNELFKEVCRIAIGFGKMQMAWVGLVDEQTKIIEPVSFAGIEDGYLSKIKKISVKNVPEGHGPTGTALREKKHIVCNDIEKDPQMAIWRDEALKRGYRSSIALPIIVFNNVIGVFSLYSEIPFFFDKEEEDLLDEVTMDISFALEMFETKEKQQKAEDLLKESEERFRSLFEHMTEGVALHEMLYDKKGNPVDYRILSVNSAFEKFIEISSQKAIGSLASELYGMAVPPYIVEYDAVVKNGKPFSFETYFPPMDTYFNISVFSPNKNQFVTVFLDITERKHTELKLADDKRFIESLINITPDILYIYDIIDQKNIFSNDGIQKILGYSVHELQEMGNHVIPLLMHPDDFLNYQKLIIPKYSTAKDNESITHEYRMKHKSDEWRWLYSNEIIYLRQPDGSPKQIFGIIHDITERKEAEEKIYKIGQHYQTLIEKAPDGIVLLNDKGEFKYISPSARKMFGYTESEVVMINPAEITHPDDLQFVLPILARLLQEPTYVPTIQYRVIDTKGNWKWVESTFRNLLGDINIESIVLNFREITDRKIAEEALQQSESLLRSITDTSKDLIFVKDRECRFVFMNPAGCIFNGKTVEQLLGKSKADFCLNPFEAAQFMADDLRIINSGQLETIEEEITAADGSIYTFLTTKVPRYDGQGNIIGLIGMAHDITKRKKAEEALKESEYRFSTIFHSSPMCIMISKFDNGVYTDVNNAFMELSGYSREECIGHSSIDLNLWINVEDREHIRKILLETGRIIGYELLMQKKTGEKVHALMSAEIIIINNEKYQLSMGYDITQQKQAEKAIIESQRLGAIGEMASSIAHDFNNSLQSIFGNVEIAMFNKDLPETTLEYLKAIKTAASDAAARVQLIQRFGGKKISKSKYTSVDVNKLISEVIIQSRPLWKDEAENKGISIQIKTTSEKIPEVFGNEGELRSVLFNIFKNGIEAMPEGGTISIGLKGETDNVVLTISDTGIGMDEETKTRIFQPFFSTKGFEIGRGLGMSGVHSIIKEHGGTILIKNTAPGKGTSIEITLPISTKNIIEEKDEGIVENTSSIRVLWVEDDEIIKENVSLMLDLLGHKGDTARSGKEALEYLDKNSYDLVITDIGMPQMSGWQLADIIKEKFKGRMKVAVVSGWGNQIEDAKKIEHGVEYVLSKPFRIEQLEKLLGAVAQSLGN